MDYNYFASSPGQPYQFNGFPPTPSYDNAPNGDLDSFQAAGQRLGPFLPPHEYDALAYAYESSDFVPVTTVSPPIPQVPYLPDGSPGAEPEHGGRAHPRRRSSSDDDREQDKGLTPAQWRRKEQNRAAQRAFRERKERHLKELEEKLAALSSQQATLESTNTLLRKELERARVENEILRASSSNRPPSPSDPRNDDDGDSPLPRLKPRETADVEELFASAHPPPPVLSSSEKWLTPSAAWDLIQSHPLVRQGSVDITDVAARLQRRATCDGAGGPVFEEGAVKEAVEGARRGSGDVLV